MKVIILCGGTGTRMEDYSLPKPLNMIYGTPAIQYCLKNLPDTITDLYFVVAQHLLEFNFEEIVRKEFKTKQCHFSILPYFTRGPVESAFLGIKDIEETSEPVMFLDNDNLYTFPESLFSSHSTAFLGYAKDTTGSEAYSFIHIDSNNTIIDYKEKKRISDNFVCGIYGFASIDQFRTVAKSILEQTTASELYMSLCYQELLKTGETIKAIYCPDCIYHIGSLKELYRAYPHIPVRKMRVCFDLDNTLVTYPTVPGDYTTVKPISKMIELLNKMYDEGHTIIIHTARRMETHKYNVGAVIRDIARITLDTLDNFNIQYHELIFGKPIADIYIDDRAVNPYFQKIETMGYLTPPEIKKPVNFLGNNKYNSVETNSNTIIKKGPFSILKGEIYYYEHLPIDTNIIQYFPKIISIKHGEQSEIHMEYIRGIPLYTLYKNGLLTEIHMNKLFEFLDCLHNLTHSDNKLQPTLENVHNNYLNKLIKRFSCTYDYPFANAKQVQDACIYHLQEYINSNLIKIVPYIHGDFWLSNILLDFKQNIKVIDMKGYVDTFLTTGGDYLYDYAKLYQSILGFDSVLYGEPVSETIKATYKKYFINELIKRAISIETVFKITFSLVMGTFHAIEGQERKERVWNWICKEFNEVIAYK